MFLPVARGLVRGVLALVVAVSATALGAAVAHAAVPRLALTALAFEQPTVDVTEEYAANKLMWTVTNTDPDAVDVHGTVTMRMRSSVTGALIGHEWIARYRFEDTCCQDARYESGTPQESTYSFHLPVRRYSDASTASWEVTKVTINAGDASAAVTGARLQSFAYRFTALTLVDNSGPTVQSISLFGLRAPYFYIGNGPATVYYDFTVQDSESGFWKGRIRLAGPGGQSITTPFTWERDEYSTGFRCGRISSGEQDGTYLSCAIGVTLPADAATGSWRLAALVLHNNAGGVSTYRNPTAPSINVTSNSTVQAGNFAISPNQVNNWRDEAMTELTMSVTGARRGISAITVDFGTGGCQQWGATTVKEDGMIAVPVRVFRQTRSCEVEGIIVTDGAGNVALYGSAFEAPDPELSITQVPSTNPPVALGATLDPTSLPASEVGQRSIQLTIQAEMQMAPIEGIEVYVYDADGEVVSQAFGGTGQADDGTVTHWLYLPWQGLEPGEYTVGFGLNDAAGMSSLWNMPDRPDSQSLPSGPIVLTVTEG
jgi:hypothetical protein